jgi:nucleoside-diphosphate-sugar epimerase
MRVLVTGGAGYIGTSLIPQLLKKGHQVRVMDSLLFGGDQLLPFFRHPDFEFTRGDVRIPADLEAAVRGCDGIIHLAAIVGYPACRRDPALATEVNVQGTRNLLRAISKQQLVLYASTGSNYGAVEEICTEETPLNPLSLYGQTKTLAETMLLEEASTVAYRIATAFGVSPRLRLDLLINDFAYRAVTQGYLVVYEKSYMRSFIHVHDIGRAFVFALEDPTRMCGQVYNVGSETMNYSKQRVCELIQQQIDCYVHYADVGADADKRNYMVSYKKITDLGYDTTLTAEDGIAELARAFEVVSFKSPYMNV